MTNTPLQSPRFPRTLGACCAERLEWARHAHGEYLLHTNYPDGEPAALWRVLEQWMAGKGLGTCGRRLLKELDELQMMDVVLPTDTDAELRLWVMAKPEKERAQRLAHLGLELPQRPRLVSDGVPKNDPQLT